MSDRPTDGNSPVVSASRPEEGASAPSFQIKDCALIAVATGRRAQNLRELRDILQTIDASSIYYHFWGSRLQPRFDNPEYQNDFAAWVHHALHDGKAAERLGVIDPTDFDSLEELRQELIDVVEERLDEEEHVTWSKGDKQFNFLTSQIVVFDTRKVITDPRELVTALPAMSPGSIFYHMIDARRRTAGSTDDIRSWLEGFGYETGHNYEDLCARISEVDPFFPGLIELRDELASVFSTYFGGSTA